MPFWIFLSNRLGIRLCWRWGIWKPLVWSWATHRKLTCQSAKSPFDKLNSCLMGFGALHSLLYSNPSKVMSFQSQKSKRPCVTYCNYNFFQWFWIFSSNPQRSPLTPHVDGYPRNLRGLHDSQVFMAWKTFWFQIYFSLFLFSTETDYRYMYTIWWSHRVLSTPS